MRIPTSLCISAWRCGGQEVFTYWLAVSYAVTVLDILIETLELCFLCVINLLAYC